LSKMKSKEFINESIKVSLRTIGAKHP